MAPWDFLFDEKTYKVGKNGVSPIQNMAAYLGGSAIQTVGDNPVTAYRQLVQQYAKNLAGETVAPAVATAEANAVFIAAPLTASMSGLWPRLIGVLFKRIPKFGVLLGYTYLSGCDEPGYAAATAASILSAPFINPVRMVEKQQRAFLKQTVRAPAPAAPTAPTAPPARPGERGASQRPHVVPALNPPRPPPRAGHREADHGDPRRGALSRRHPSSPREDHRLPRPRRRVLAGVLEVFRAPLPGDGPADGPLARVGGARPRRPAQAAKVRAATDRPGGTAVRLRDQPHRVGRRLAHLRGRHQPALPPRGHHADQLDQGQVDRPLGGSPARLHPSPLLLAPLASHRCRNYSGSLPLQRSPPPPRRGQAVRELGADMAKFGLSGIFRGQGIGIFKAIISLTLFHEGRLFLTRQFKAYNVRTGKIPATATA